MTQTACVSWRPLQGFDGASLSQERLGVVLESWLETPYRPGGRQRGPHGGVDCVRFVCEVLDELYGVPRSNLPTLPNDYAMHQRAGAVAAMRFILRLYEPNEPVNDGALEPGDVVVAAQLGGGPGHALIVGARPNEIWHAIGRRVQKTGIGILSGDYSEWKFVAAYRVSDKARWAR